MGIHGIFEGLSIGLAENSGEVLALSITIISHKWTEGLILGLALVEAKIPSHLFTYVIAL